MSLRDGQENLHICLGGCPRSKPQQRIGERYGKLTVLAIAKAATRGHCTKYLCKCDCGKTAIVSAKYLTSGHTTSCGCKCLRKGSRATGIYKHGKSKTKLYRVWSVMKDRVFNSNNPAYQRYGGRGITVCAEWEDYMPFENWALSNGYAEGLELDRIDNDGNYSPDNCRWVTHAQNLENTHRKTTVVLNGEIVTAAELARRIGKPYIFAYSRIKRGWSGERIKACAER